MSKKIQKVINLTLNTIIWTTCSNIALAAGYAAYDPAIASRASFGHVASDGPYGGAGSRDQHWVIKAPIHMRISRVVIKHGHLTNSIECFASPALYAGERGIAEISLGGRKGGAQGKEGTKMDIPEGHYLTGVSLMAGDAIDKSRLHSTHDSSEWCGTSGGGVLREATAPHPGLELYKIEGNVCGAFDRTITHLSFHWRHIPIIERSLGTFGSSGGIGRMGGAGGIPGYSGTITMLPAIGGELNIIGPAGLLTLPTNMYTSSATREDGRVGRAGIGGRGGSHGRDFHRTRRGAAWADMGVLIKRPVAAARAADGGAERGNNNAEQARPVEQSAISQRAVLDAYALLRREIFANPATADFVERFV